MAVLYVTEYVGLTSQGPGLGQVPIEPPVVEQAIPITAGSTLTALFNARTKLVRLHTDAICAVKIDAAPVATVVSAGLGSGRLAANQTEFRGVGPGLRAAVISTT